MSVKGNSVVIVDKGIYIKRMKNLLSDEGKLEKVSLKNDVFLNLVVNQEKCTDAYFLWNQKKRTSWSFLMLKLYANKVNLQTQFIEDLLLVANIVTLKLLAFVYKFGIFGMVYTLVYRWFHIFFKLGKIPCMIDFFERNIS